MDLEIEALSLTNKAMKTLHPDSQFIPGVSPVPVTGKVFGSSEIHAAVSASLDFWLTSGPYTESFENRFAPWSDLSRWVIKWADNFDVLTTCKRGCEVACSKAWVNSAIDKC